MSITPRDYQLEALNRLSEGWGASHQKQILTMPTGSGKTATAVELIRLNVAQGRRCLFVVHLIELIPQTVRHLDALGIKAGILQGDNTRNLDADCVVASIQTISSRGCPPGFMLVVIDECHVLHKAHIELIRAHTNAAPDRLVIGLTATPLRPDLGRHFENMVTGASIRQLTDAGYLCKLRAYAPGRDDMERLLDTVAIDYKQGDYQSGELGRKLSTKKIVGDVVSTWIERAANRKTLVFACNVAHAETLRDSFIAEGIQAETISYRTDDAERRELIARFRAGDIQMLTSVDVLAIGFDVPDVECGIMARPTLSQIVYLQQAGRLLRSSPGKTDALLLDHAGNSLRFGLPIDFEPPALGEGDTRFSQKKLREHKARNCANCEAVLPPSVPTCPECGHDQPMRKPRVEHLPGELVEVGKQSSALADGKAERQRFYQMLKHIQKSRGYKPGWVYAKFVEKYERIPPRHWRNLPAIPPDQSVLNWVRYSQIRWSRSQQRQAALSSL